MVQLENVCQSYPGGVVAVDHLTLQIDEGECVVLLGPSGCGKTTTLRMINQLIAPMSGKIFVEGENIERMLPKTPVTFTKLQGGELQKMILEAHGDDDKHSLITQLTGTLNQCIKKWAPMEKLQ